jgi:hypothetical protein
MAKLPKENDLAKVIAADGTTVEAPAYLWELQYMAYTNRPLFIGRLENDWWKESETLVKGIEEGWMEIVPDEGFVITEKGKDVLRQHGLHTTRHPFEGWTTSSDYDKWTEAYKRELKRKNKR